MVAGSGVPLLTSEESIIMSDVTADAARAFLRHTVATLAYRGGKVVRDAPASFSATTAGAGTRQAGAILAHVGDLLDWALGLADGVHVWKNAEPLPWDAEVARFFTALDRFDHRLAADAPLGFPAERIFQGPVADALTHVGQLAMLRRVAGAPVPAENYFRAAIIAGQVEPERSADRVEFD